MKNPTQTAVLVFLSLAFSVVWGIALGYSEIHKQYCANELSLMFTVWFHVVLMTFYIFSVCVNFILFDYMEESTDNKGQVALWRRRAIVFIGLRISLLAAWMFVFFYHTKKDVFSSFVIGTHFLYVVIEMLGFVYAIMADKAHSKYTKYYYISVGLQLLVSFLLLIITIFHTAICKT
tara:strand:+ start:12060 stop:12590 length:531 start_codon:yes stop_codon:yes gene_type:complete